MLHFRGCSLKCCRFTPRYYTSKRLCSQRRRHSSLLYATECLRLAWCVMFLWTDASICFSRGNSNKEITNTKNNQFWISKSAPLHWRQFPEPPRQITSPPRPHAEPSGEASQLTRRSVGSARHDRREKLDMAGARRFPRQLPRQPSASASQHGTSVT